MKESRAASVPALVESGAGREVRRERAEETKARIRKVAIELFAAKGYGSTTTDHIAAGAHVGKGTVFYSFGSKAELYTHILSAIADEFTEGIIRARADLTGFDALDAIGYEILTIADANPAAGQILLVELLRADQRWVETLTEARAQIIAPIARTLHQTYQQRKEAGGETGPGTAEHFEIVAQAFVIALGYAGVDHACRGGEIPLGAIYASLSGAVSGLRP